MLLIKGGPRTCGATGKMLDFLQSYANEKGWICHRYDLYEKRLAPCTGCKNCRKTSICIIKDDITELKNQIIKCNMVVLSAPTYFANVPGPVKNMFDRLSGVIIDDMARPKLSKEKRYILLTACSTKAPWDRLTGQSTGTLRAMQEFFKMGGMTCQGKVIYSGTSEDAVLPDRIKNKIRRLLP